MTDVTKHVRLRIAWLLPEEPGFFAAAPFISIASCSRRLKRRKRSAVLPMIPLSRSVFWEPMAGAIMRLDRCDGTAHVIFAGALCLGQPRKPASDWC
jgi:hypothetical protein